MLVHDASQAKEEAIRKNNYRDSCDKPLDQTHPEAHMLLDFPVMSSHSLSLVKVIEVGFSCFYFSQHEKATTGIDGKQVCGWVNVRSVCLPVASKSRRAEKLVLLFSRRTEKLSGGDKNPDSRVDLNVGAMGMVTFQETGMWLVLRSLTQPALLVPRSVAYVQK